MKIFLEDGSIAPLGIGLCLISLSAIVVSTNSASLFVMQKRLTNAAESIVVESTLSSVQTNELAKTLFADSIENLQIKMNQLSDGITRQIIACGKWHAPIPTIFVPAEQVLCTHAEARDG